MWSYKSHSCSRRPHFGVSYDVVCWEACFRNGSGNPRQPSRITDATKGGRDGARHSVQRQLKPEGSSGRKQPQTIHGHQSGNARKGWAGWGAQLCPRGYTRGLAQLPTFKEMKWISTDSGFWPYLRYNLERKKLDPIVDAPGLPTNVLKYHIKALVRHVGEDNATMRFHPIRPLVEHMTGDTIMFLIQAGSHSESAAQVCLHLRALCGISATQLRSLCVSPDRLQRSGLATQISKNLRS